MILENLLRTTVGVLVGTATVLALGRCSPIAPSLSKTEFRQGSRPGPTQPALPDNPLSRPPIHIFHYNMQIVDVGSVERADEDESEPLAKEETVKKLTVALSDQQLKEFRKKGSIQIIITSDQLPESGKARFELALTRDEIIFLELMSVETRLSTQGDGVWTLNFPPHADARKAELIRENLAGVTITLRLASDKTDLFTDANPRINQEHGENE